MKFGLYVPSVMISFYNHNVLTYRADLQIKVMKDIIDFFGTGDHFHLKVKGLKEHQPHELLHDYTNKYNTVSYTDIPLKTALANNPLFVIIDNSSTPILEILTHYNGLIYFINVQKSQPVREDALKLLKKAVFYSESINELKDQFSIFNLRKVKYESIT